MLRARRSWCWTIPTSCSPSWLEATRAGAIDQRVLAVLEALSIRFRISVSVLKSGHSPYARGTTSYPSHHFGRAVDLFAVNGQLLSLFNAAAWELTICLGQFPPRSAAQ